MADVPYFKPHEAGPLFDGAEDIDSLAGDVETFLDCEDRDAEVSVAQQNRKDLAETSFKLWVAEQTRDVQDR